MPPRRGKKTREAESEMFRLTGMRKGDVVLRPVVNHELTSMFLGMQSRDVLPTLRYVLGEGEGVKSCVTSTPPVLEDHFGYAMGSTTLKYLLLHFFAARAFYQCYFDPMTPSGLGFMKHPVIKRGWLALILDGVHGEQGRLKFAPGGVKSNLSLAEVRGQKAWCKRRAEAFGADGATFTRLSLWYEMRYWDLHMREATLACSPRSLKVYLEGFADYVARMREMRRMCEEAPPEAEQRLQTLAQIQARFAHLEGVQSDWVFTELERDEARLQKEEEELSKLG